MAEYDKIAKFFLDRRKEFNHFDYNRDIEVPAMIKLIGNVKGKTILDVGCGFGDHIKKLSDKGAKKSIGFDASKELIKLANNQNIKNAKFFVGNMDKKFKFEDESFDIVISSLAIHYVKNLKQFYFEAHRVLKKGGFFIFSTGHPIFDLINQTDGLVGVKGPKGNREIFGDYFDESPKLMSLGSLGTMNCYSYTFETFIKNGLNINFELVDYVDAKPVPSSKNYDLYKYKLVSRLPSFMLFKWLKK